MTQQETQIAAPEQAAFQEWQSKVSNTELLQELQNMKNNTQAISDAFYQDLEFGTAGLRGIIGAGTNRMNIYTVSRATQGFADYLNAHFDKPSVVIGRDSRNKGEDFIRCTASVFAANGIHAYVFPEIVPTPAISFAVRELACSGGVNMTASHNPAPYNGYKAYGPDGCQIVTQAAKDISAAISQVDTFSGVKSCDFDQALSQGAISWVKDEVLDSFIDAVEACSLASESDKQTQLKLVYTPLNGTGIDCVKRILSRVGIHDISVVDEQAKPDGNFPTCPYPNPEIREALELAIQLSEKVQPDLLLATDPDADRVGIGVKDGEDYLLLSGNEVGVLLLDYIARKMQERNEDLSQKIAVTTIVSSTMVDALAQKYGFEVRRVLTGFKYIGEVIGELESQGTPERFMFGFEESYGYLNGTHVRDKDAIDASMLICQMAQFYKAQGMNLADAMRALYQEHGFYQNRTLSFSFPGASGSQKMQELMSSLRTQAPYDIAGLKVLESCDYQEGIQGLPPANVVEFSLEGGNKAIVRPSGTEPKVKAYLFTKHQKLDEAKKLLDELQKALEQMVK